MTRDDEPARQALEATQLESAILPTPRPAGRVRGVAASAEDLLAHRSAYERVMAAVGDDDESILDELLAPDLVDHNAIADQQPGREGFKQWMRAARTSFPDLQVSVEDVVAEGDRVAGRVLYRGTHDGALAGVGGTGRRVEFEAFHVVRFRDRQIIEWWGTADLLGALLQAGARVVGPDA